MKKLLTSLLLLLLVFAPNARAVTITLDSVTYADGRITVAGTGEGEIQIVVFNVNKEPVYFTTTTASGGKFSLVLPVIEGLEGECTIQIGDYKGENTTSKTIKVTKTGTVNPLTSDSVLLYGVLFVVSAILLVFSIRTYLKKRA